MSVKVKICGTRTLEGTQGAVEAGADFLGFIFVHSSKRYIEAEKAKPIIDAVRGKIAVVGVFENPIPHRVNELVRYLGLEYVQLHGAETNEYCQTIQASVIKAFRLPSNVTFDEARNKLREYKVEYHMVDREKQAPIQSGQRIGEMVDPDLAAKLAKEFSLFYSGGLTPENVSEVVQKVAPFAVDVAGGIETNGEQDQNKIREFVRKAKEIRN